MTNLQEKWLPIQGFTNYSISSIGRIKNIKTGRIRLATKTFGYYSIRLFTGGKRSMFFKVHRLVALAFISNPNNHPIVNHKDGNKDNNNVANLEWCTQKENLSHSRIITRNGAVISTKKIINLYNKNPNDTKESFIQRILDNCN